MGGGESKGLRVILSVPQWDVRSGCSLGAALAAQFPWVGARGSHVAVCGEQGSGTGPCTGISLGMLTLVSVSAPCVADKSHLSHSPGRAGCWMWASSCMTQHETCMSGPWRPRLGDKGWDCTDLGAAGALADLLPVWLWGEEFLRRDARSGSCFYQHAETIGPKLLGNLNQANSSGESCR